jgi:hypothetical protein
VSGSQIAKFGDPAKSATNRKLRSVERAVLKLLRAKASAGTQP